MSADFYGCLIEIAFLFKFSQRHSFAVFIFDVGVFQLTAEAVAEIGKIFLSQFLLFSLFCFTLGKPVFRLFSSETEVLEIAAKMLMYMAPCYWLFVPIEMLSGSLRGMGNTVIPTIITAMGICVFRTIWMFTVVPVWHEILAITISYPISWIMTSSAFIVYYNIVKKRLMPGEYSKN